MITQLIAKLQLVKDGQCLGQVNNQCSVDNDEADVSIGAQSKCLLCVLKIAKINLYLFIFNYLII